MLHKLKVIIAILKTQKNPFRILWAYFLLETGLNRFVKINMDGYKINLTRSNLAIVLYANKHDRHDDEDFLKAVLQAEDTYVDIGANIGTLVLKAASIVGPSGKVVGIEAHPTTFSYLTKNVNTNKFQNVKLINTAVGDAEGKVVFSNLKGDDQNKVIQDSKNGIEVPIVKLDNILKTEAKINLLKIDVEGFEKMVLQGAMNTLENTDIVFYESWEKHFKQFNYTTSEVIEMLKSKDFEVFRLQGNSLFPVGENYVSEKCENLVATRYPEILESKGFEC